MNAEVEDTVRTSDNRTGLVIDVDGRWAWVRLRVGGTRRYLLSHLRVLATAEAKMIDPRTGRPRWWLGAVA